jgi:glycosyltransferase involved in cell wall biosynthesis
MLLSFMEAAREYSGLALSAVVLNHEFHAGLRQRLETMGWPVSFYERQMGDKHPRHILRLLKQVDTERIQVIHAHDPGSKMAALVCKALRPHLKVVFTVHDTHIIAGLSKPKRLLHRYALNGHVAISESVAQECLDHGLNNVRKLYNGVDLSQFTPRRLQPRSAHEPVRLVQVARFELYKKGQDILLKALRLCLDQGLPVQLSLVGMVPDDLPEPQQQFQQLRQMIRSLGLEAHVDLLVNRTDVPAILQTQDVFVLPSRKEGFGLVIIEAMASGLPVIASRLDGPAELIQHENNGLLFQPEDSSALAEQIKRLVRATSQEFERFAIAGLETARQFSIQQMVAGYANYYRDLL